MGSGSGCGRRLRAVVSCARLETRRPDWLYRRLRGAAAPHRPPHLNGFYIYLFGFSTRFRSSCAPSSQVVRTEIYMNRLSRAASRVALAAPCGPVIAVPCGPPTTRPVFQHTHTHNSHIRDRQHPSARSRRLLPYPSHHVHDSTTRSLRGLHPHLHLMQHGENTAHARPYASDACSWHSAGGKHHNSPRLSCRGSHARRWAQGRLA